MAEGVGFEPTIRFPVYTLSKRAPSATRPSLRGRGAQYSRGRPADNPCQTPMPASSIAERSGRRHCPKPARPTAPRRHGPQRTAVALMTASMPLRPITKSHRRADRIAGRHVVLVARERGRAAARPPPRSRRGSGKRVHYRPCTDPTLRKSRSRWPFRRCHQKPE
jgi:hypothetical protein